MNALRLCALVILLAVFPSGFLTAAGWPAAEPMESVSPAEVRNNEVVARTVELRKSGDTRGLEALAVELRGGEESLDDGTWMLSSFYNAAVAIPDTESEAAEALNFYQEWAVQSPSSSTAQLCLVRALVAHATMAQSSNWGGGNPAERRQRLQKRLENANAVLTAAAQLKEQCPGWFEAGQILALEQNWKRDHYLNFVEDAITREPTYGSYYAKACAWLAPSWTSPPGEAEKWIAGQADAYVEDQQDWQYAQFVWLADQPDGAGEIVFKPGRFDWERTKRGFEKWLAKEPKNRSARFEFTRLAVLAGDRETARAQFEITGGQYPSRLWEDPHQFDEARRFAYEGGKNPLDGEKSPLRPRQKISPEAIAQVAAILRVTGHLTGGIFAGVALLILAWQRRAPGAGWAALVAAVAVAGFLGTLATAIPAAGLCLFLRSKKLVHPPELFVPSGWMILLWVLVLAASSLILQAGAAVLAVVPHLLKLGPSASQESLLLMTRDGMVFRIVVAAAWLTFLGLLLVCGPQNRAGWQRRLGLHGVRPISSLWWTLPVGIAIVMFGLLAGNILDERSLEAVKLLAQGAQSPAGISQIWFFLAVAVAAPLIEELLFRGYAFSGWVEKMGPWGAILVPAAIFTMAHVQYGWIGLLNVLFIGVALGFLRWKTGSVYPCIALHMGYNSMVCVQAVLESSA